MPKSTKKVCLYKGAEVNNRHAQKRKGRKTGYVRVTLKGPPRQTLLVSFPDWDEHHEIVERIDD